ncbi:hypothetical protein GQX74_009969 [Glossina fuscipes]|nr:hypothetical protein GQX74_009969 [Glossina fuscipes]
MPVPSALSFKLLNRCLLNIPCIVKLNINHNVHCLDELKFLYKKHFGQRYYSTKLSGSVLKRLHLQQIVPAQSKTNEYYRCTYKKNQICKYEATAKVKRTFPNSITATYLRLPKLESHKYSLKMNNRNQKKVKRKTITLETKIAILNRLADGEGSTALGKEYKLGESTIRAIQKRASRINESKNSATNESAALMPN